MNTFYKVTFRKIEKPLPVLHKLWLYIFIIVNTQSVIGSTQQLQDQVNNKKQQLHFTISGTIKDKATGETMIGATIVIKDHNTGVVTNEYGFFSITLPKNDYILQVSYVGFVPKEIKVHLDSHKKYEIELTMSSNALDEVLITSENNSKSQVKNVLLGTSSLKSKDIKMFPPLLGEADVTRALLTQPGVTTIGEGATGYNVRGGNIDQNLILLDEAPIYNSSHLWGFFSIFNTDAIKDVKLYKGGIPARFGGRASSVLEIRQKEGSLKRFKAEGGLGLLFSRLTVETPIVKEKLSFLASGRRSYFDLFFPLGGDDIENTNVHFYDLNTKLKWDINENNKLFVSGYFGADVMRLSFDGETNSEGKQEPDEKIDFRWKNATATVRWNHIFSNKLFMNLSGIYSKYNYSLSSKNDAGGGPANTSGTFTWKSAVENWIIKPDFTFYKNATTKIRFGLNTTLYRFTPAKITSAETGINNINFKTEKGLEVAPYIEYETTFNAFSLNAGIRYSWFGNIGPYDVALYDPGLPKTPGTILETKNYKKGDLITSYAGFEPRLSLSYTFNDRKALKIGYNRLFQYIHLISNTNAALPFDIWKPSGFHIKPLEVNQLSMGYAYDTHKKTYNFSIEGYYKTFKNMVEYKDGADLFVNKNIETELLPAKAYSYGLEIGAYKSKGKLQGNLNYTYAVTRRKTVSSFKNEDINDGDYYPSNYDRPHVANLSAIYSLNKKWGISTFFTYQTGRPITLPTSRINFNNDNSYLNYSNRNAFRLSDTHRLDVSFTYTPKNENKKWKNSWVFGVYNIYARKNAFSEYTTFTNGILKHFRFSVIGAPIPFITYNFKF